MLVLLSDLHLTDETTAENVHPEAFTNILMPEIAASAQSKKAQDLDIVLLGDILDLVRTDYWLTIDSAERPWNGELDKDTAMNTSARVAAHFQNALQKILATRAAHALKSVCLALNGLKVEGRAVTPRIIYIVGNHDRALLNYPSLQKQFSDWLGCPVIFAQEWTAADYHLLARHGHLWDDKCHGSLLLKKALRKKIKHRRADLACHLVQTIGEVITAELMSGLVYRVRTQAGARNTAGLHKLIMQANNVRPEPQVLRWLEWMGQSRFNKTDKKLVMSALRDSMQAVLDSRLAGLWDKIKPDWLVSGDITDRLTLMRAALKLDFDNLAKIIPALANAYGVVAASKSAYADGAREELAAHDVEYVVYGHTHFAATEYLSAEQNGRVKMYINTGTYLPLVQKARDHGFGTDYRMTFTAFYRPEEDARAKDGRVVSCEIWSGHKRKQYL